MGTLLLYQHILITIALFIFIVNQANILYDTFHIVHIRRRIVKNLNISPPKGITIAAEKRAKELTEWPTWHFNWWAISGCILILVLVSGAAYILFGYDPNPR